MSSLARSIPLDELAESDLYAWRRLATAAVEPNPFFEPDFILPAVRFLDAGPSALQVVESENEWLACLPVAMGRWRRALPALFAWRGLYGFLGTPLVAAGHEHANAEILKSASLQAGRRALVLENASSDGPLADAEGRDSGSVHHRVSMRTAYERATLHRSPEGEYLGHVKPRHRREWRRQRRRLEEAIGAEITSRDRADDPGAIEDFLALERGGWKGRSNTALASAEGDAEFFRRVCEGFAGRKRLQLLELRCGERILAMKCNLMAPPGSFAFKIAFDEAYSQVSPGIQLELENLEAFHQSGLAWMDSCADPDNAMINRLWTGRRRLESKLLVPRGLVGATMAAGLKVGLRLRGGSE